MTQEQEHKWSEWAMFQDVMKLVALYDWATEGGYPPKGQNLTRTEAITIRNGLVKLAGEIV